VVAAALAVAFGAVIASVVFAAALLADSGICTAPVPIAIPRPSSAATDPMAVTSRNDSGRRKRRAFGRRWDACGRPDPGRLPGKRSKLDPSLTAVVHNDSAY